MTTLSIFAKKTNATTPWVDTVWTKFRRANAVLRQRKALAKLNCAALNDIGLSRTQARQESLRHAWDVPTNWRA